MYVQFVMELELIWYLCEYEYTVCVLLFFRIGFGYRKMFIFVYGMDENWKFDGKLCIQLNVVEGPGIELSVQMKIYLKYL